MKKMVIITEVDPTPDSSPPEQVNQFQRPQSYHLPDHNAPDFRKSAASPNPYLFRYKLSIAVAFLSIVLLFPSLWERHDSRSSSFLRSLPAPLKLHHSKGMLINIQINDQPIEIFKLESENSADAREKVVIVHGIGLSSFAFRGVVNVLGDKGVRAIAFDLPGHGFSKPLMEEIWEEGGVFDKLASVFNLIKEKGVFWALETAIETGNVPYEEIETLLQRGKKVSKPSALGSGELGNILDDLIAKLGLAPIHLVLHDSVLSLAGNWVSENPNAIKSVTLLNPSSTPAMPLGFLKFPLFFFLVSRFDAAYGVVIRFCCGGGLSDSDIASHRVLFRNGASAIIAMNNEVDEGFQLGVWGRSAGLKTTPLHVVWSRDGSSRWSGEVAEALPLAKIDSHCGGRWPNEEGSKEIGDLLYDFVSTFPKYERSNIENGLKSEL